MALHPCPVCAERTIEERSQYEVCSVCGWEDDLSDDQPWSTSGPNGRLSLWEARFRYAFPDASGEERAAHLERLRAAEAERQAPAFLGALNRTLGTSLTAADVVPPDEADRLSLAVWRDPGHAPAPGEHEPLGEADVDDVLGRAELPASAVLLDLRYEQVIGGVLVDPRVVLDNWRAYTSDHSPWLVLAERDLAGWLVVEPTGDGWKMVSGGRVRPWV